MKMPARAAAGSFPTALAAGFLEYAAFAGRVRSLAEAGDPARLLDWPGRR
jgi:hypothetical protein